MININTAALSDHVTLAFLLSRVCSCLQEGTIDAAPGAVFLRERWQDAASLSSASRDGMIK
jgi:hypothetical protein